MEEVAGTAEKLAKDKVTAPPPPFRRRATQSIYSRVYSEDGKEARNKRAEQRRLRATGIEKLGEEEYKKVIGRNRQNDADTGRHARTDK